jgi:Holliday junction DNA helicase RuvA
MALAILSGTSADEFARCVQDGDTATLVRLPGVGKKTAERLIVEMRDRLSDWESSLSQPMQISGTAPLGVVGDQQTRDAISALISLGYKPPEASRMVSRVESEGMDSEAIIRAALKQAIS